MIEIHVEIFSIPFRYIFFCRRKFPISSIFHSKPTNRVSWAFSFLLTKKTDLFDGLMIRCVAIAFIACVCSFDCLLICLSIKRIGICCCILINCEIRFDLIVIQYPYIISTCNWYIHLVSFGCYQRQLCTLWLGVICAMDIWWHWVGFPNCWFIRKQLCINYRKGQGIR